MNATYVFSRFPPPERFLSLVLSCVCACEYVTLCLCLYVCECWCVCVCVCLTHCLAYFYCNSSSIWYTSPLRSTIPHVPCTEDTTSQFLSLGDTRMGNLIHSSSSPSSSPTSIVVSSSSTVVCCPSSTVDTSFPRSAASSSSLCTSPTPPSCASRITIYFSPRVLLVMTPRHLHRFLSSLLRLAIWILSL